VKYLSKYVYYNKFKTLLSFRQTYKHIGVSVRLTVVMLKRMERMYKQLIPVRTHILEPDSMSVEKVWQFSTLSVPAAGYPKHTRNARKDVR
jgi:hypothetical protein